MSDHTKSLFDWLSLSAAVGTIMGWIPQIAGLFSIVWLGLQIYAFLRNKKWKG